ncbi:hypothetical protein [Myroides sp. DF42-4-2]|nr:hypothetical protein [Myroides sp. DF42-4-2]MDM1409094.1 hypothetical protein [Myroides sp. DF42-4-2]
MELLPFVEICLVWRIASVYELEGTLTRPEQQVMGNTEHLSIQIVA